ncbi:hypothetical protein ACHAPU_010136 [Fusarium lateritium]
MFNTPTRSTGRFRNLVESDQEELSDDNEDENEDEDGHQHEDEHIELDEAPPPFVPPKPVPFSASAVNHSPTRLDISSHLDSSNSTADPPTSIYASAIKSIHGNKHEKRITTSVMSINNILITLNLEPTAIYPILLQPNPAVQHTPIRVSLGPPDDLPHDHRDFYRPKTCQEP